MSSLTKEKKMAAQYLSHIDQWLQEALQLRSSVFQVCHVTSEAPFTRYNRLSNRFDNRVNVCIHDNTTGCETGLTNACIVYTAGYTTWFDNRLNEQLFV